MPDTQTGVTKVHTETITRADHTRVDHKRLRETHAPLKPESGDPSSHTGLSGLLRKMAFRYSESGFGHWLPLIFADRVKIWEGFLHNFRRRKHGLKAELRYNKSQFLAKTSVKVLVGAFVFAWLLTSPGRKKEKGKRKK